MPMFDDDDNPNVNSKANYWGEKSSNVFIPISIKAPTLPPGKFVITKDYNDNLNYTKIKDEFEHIIYNPTIQAKEILEDVKKFWGYQKFFAANNITQRTGVLFFGTQGTGKSIIVSQITREHIENGGVVFQGTPQKGDYDSFVEGLRTFRKVEPTRPLICVFEEIDKIIAKTGDSHILGILDGEYSINHMISLATTNHPEDLDPTIVNRPRRFDRIIEIGFPDEETRTTFFKTKNLNGKELELWVNNTSELSFAAMTELFVLVKAYGRDFEKSLARMKKMMVETPKLEKFRKSIGFGGK